MARWQLSGAGITSSMLETRIANGHLLRLHRGVYAVGHDRLRREGRWLAAVLAAGPGAALSHRDAAGLHGLRPANHERLDVTTPQRGRASHPGIVVRHARLDPLDVMTLDTIPVTTVARTLVDLAGLLRKDHLAKVINEAERRGAFDLDAIEGALARVRTRRGRGHVRLRAALADLATAGATLTRSELEDRFLALLAAQDLPRARTNAQLHGFEVDALWPARRLVVELDGYANHGTRRAFQRDRTKANALTAAGWTVLRYTHADVVERPAEIAAQLRPLLAP